MHPGFPNQKPWINSEVHKPLIAQDRVFRSGDRALYTTARSDLKRGIRAGKRAYRDKGNKKAVTTTNGAQLAEELNSFFARFETRSPFTPPPLATGKPALTFQQHEVRHALKAVNPRKAAGPDGVPGKVHRACCYELFAVFTNIFNLSLAHANVPPI